MVKFKTVISKIFSNEKAIIAWFLISTIFCLCETVIFANTPEIFEFGAELGDFLSAIGYSYIVSAIGYSYIVSAVFYFVALKVDRDNKKTHYAYVKKKVYSIMRIIRLNLHEMMKSEGMPYKTDDEIRALLAKVKTEAKSPLILHTRYGDNGDPIYEYGNWAMYIVNNNIKAMNQHNQILPFMAIINPELASEINDLMDIELFNTWHQTLLYGDFHDHPDLRYMSSTFISATHKCNEINKLLEMLDKK